jgi:hypothetical protein
MLWGSVVGEKKLVLDQPFALWAPSYNNNNNNNNIY